MSTEQPSFCWGHRDVFFFAMLVFGHLKRDTCTGLRSKHLSEALNLLRKPLNRTHGPIQTNTALQQGPPDSSPSTWPSEVQVQQVTGQSRLCFSCPSQETLQTWPRPDHLQSLRYDTPRSHMGTSSQVPARTPEPGQSLQLCQPYLNSTGNTSHSKRSCKLRAAGHH